MAAGKDTSANIAGSCQQIATLLEGNWTTYGTRKSDIDTWLATQLATPKTTINSVLTTLITASQRAPSASLADLLV